MADEKGIKDPAKKYSEGNKSKSTPPIKKKKKTNTKNGAPVYHIVKSGQVLSTIAIKYKTTVDKIRKLNKLNPKKDNTLQIGQKLRVK